MVGKKYLIACFLCAGVFFGGGLLLWLQAHYYQPRLPQQDFPRRFAYRESGTRFSGARYQALQNGALFFGKPAATAAPSAGSPVIFQSRLVLWGITGGQESRAVVGSDPQSNQQTEILKVGDEYAGETVVAIGPDYIVVRNQSGKGRVYLGDGIAQ